MNKRRLPLVEDKKSQEILENLCHQHGITLSLVLNLIEIQRDNLGRGLQIGISQEFSAVLSEFLEERKGRADAIG